MYKRNYIVFLIMISQSVAILIYLGSLLKMVHLKPNISELIFRMQVRLELFIINI